MLREIDPEIVSYLRNGFDVEACATILDVARDYVVARIRIMRHEGEFPTELLSRVPRLRRRPRADTAILALWKRCSTVSEVARTAEVSRSTIYAAIRRLRANGVETQARPWGAASPADRQRRLADAIKAGAAPVTSGEPETPPPGDAE